LHVLSVEGCHESVKVIPAEWRGSFFLSFSRLTCGV
jgi:hypothetical protein